jgi:hypothetical protein
VYSVIYSHDDKQQPRTFTIFPWSGGRGYAAPRNSAPNHLCFLLARRIVVSASNVGGPSSNNNASSTCQSTSSTAGRGCANISGGGRAGPTHETHDSRPTTNGNSERPTRVGDDFTSTSHPRIGTRARPEAQAETCGSSSTRPGSTPASSVRGGPGSSTPRSTWKFSALLDGSAELTVENTVLNTLKYEDLMMELKTPQELPDKLDNNRLQGKGPVRKSLNHEARARKALISYHRRHPRPQVTRVVRRVKDSAIHQHSRPCS